MLFINIQTMSLITAFKLRSLAIVCTLACCAPLFAVNNDSSPLRLKTELDLLEARLIAELTLI